MPSLELILERLNQLSGILLFFFIPGVIFLTIGIKTWVTKSFTLMDRNYSMQGWRRPKFVTGQKALFWAKLDIIIGVFCLATCLLTALSVL